MLHLRTNPTVDAVSPVPSTPEQSGQASQGGPGGVRIDSQASPVGSFLTAFQANDSPSCVLQSSRGPSQGRPQLNVSRTGKRRGRNSRHAKSESESIPCLVCMKPLLRLLAAFQRKTDRAVSYRAPEDTVSTNHNQTHRALANVAEGILGVRSHIRDQYLLWYV